MKTKNSAELVSMLIIITVSLFNLSSPTVAQNLQVTYNHKGINTLSYNGVKLVDAAAHPEDGFQVYEYFRQLPNGSIEQRHSSDNNYGATWDSQKNILIWWYDWGQIQCRYEQLGDRLNLKIAIVNDTSADIIKGVSIYPMCMRFPAIPEGWDADSSHVVYGTKGGGAIYANSQAGAFVYCNEDTTRQLYTGILAVDPDTEKYNRFPLWVGTAPLSSQPDPDVMIARPVGPGQTDVYVLSLRFGPKNSSLQALMSNAPQPVSAPPTRSFHAIDIGPGTGLHAEYFKDPANEETYYTTKVLDRVDPTIDFNWTKAPPESSMNKDAFSVRWTGKIVPKYTSRYVIHVTSDGCFRMWMNDKLFMDKWDIPHPPINHFEPAELKAGQKYEVKLEYRHFPNLGPGMVKMEWYLDEYPNLSTQVIPSSELYPN